MYLLLCITQSDPKQNSSYYFDSNYYRHYSIVEDAQYIDRKLRVLCVRRYATHTFFSETMRLISGLPKRNGANVAANYWIMCVLVHSN